MKFHQDPETMLKNINMWDTQFFGINYFKRNIFKKPKFNLFGGLIWLLIYHTAAYSQEIAYLEGIVVNGNSQVQDVHIKNISNAEAITTNEEGAFKIKAKIGDSLVISHIAMKESMIVIRRSYLESKPFIFEMNNHMIELDEVKINQYANIDAVSLGIIPKKLKKLTPNERKLYTAGDFKLIHLLTLLGGSLEIDPIINKISGRTKRIKKYIEIDRKRDNIHFLKTNYYEYMINNLELSDEDIGLFLYYLVDQHKLQNLIDQNQDAKLKFFICDSWIKFKKQRSEEDI